MIFVRATVIHFLIEFHWKIVKKEFLLLYVVQLEELLVVPGNHTIIFVFAISRSWRKVQFIGGWVAASWRHFFGTILLLSISSFWFGVRCSTLSKFCLCKWMSAKEKKTEQRVRKKFKNLVVLIPFHVHFFLVRLVLFTCPILRCPWKWKWNFAEQTEYLSFIEWNENSRVLVA